MVFLSLATLAWTILIEIENPLTRPRRKLIPDLFSASLIVAMLGFFESTTASKSLGTTYNLTVSSNRELVALGS